MMIAPITKIDRQHRERVSLERSGSGCGRSTPAPNMMRHHDDQADVTVEARSAAFSAKRAAHAVDGEPADTGDQRVQTGRQPVAQETECSAGQHHLAEASRSVPSWTGPRARCCPERSRGRSRRPPARSVSPKNSTLMHADERPSRTPCSATSRSRAVATGLPCRSASGMPPRRPVRRQRLWIRSGDRGDFSKRVDMRRIMGDLDRRNKCLRVKVMFPTDDGQVAASHSPLWTFGN